MHSTRRSLLFVLAASACLAVASALSSAAAVVRGAGATLRTLAVATAAFLLGGLRLFADQNPIQIKAPHARQGLTSRERHDLNDSPAMRPTVSPRWRLVPST